MLSSVAVAEVQMQQHGRLQATESEEGMRRGCCSMVRLRVYLCCQQLPAIQLVLSSCSHVCAHAFLWGMLCPAAQLSMMGMHTVRLSRSVPLLLLQYYKPSDISPRPASMTSAPPEPTGSASSS
jgi:hypothetical protein